MWRADETGSVLRLVVSGAGRIVVGGLFFRRLRLDRIHRESYERTKMSLKPRRGSHSKGPLFRVEGFDAVLAQFGANVLEMLAVARLDRAEDVTAETSELAKARSCTTCLMLAPTAAICAVRSARPPGRSLMIARETREPAVGDQAALDHAAEDIRIDVAAAEEQHDAFAGQFWELAGKTGGERSSRPRLRRRLFPARRCAGSRARFASSLTSTALSVCSTRNLEGIAADLRNGETVGQRRAGLDADRFTRFERGGKTGDVIGFDGDDFHFGPQSFHRERDAGEQTAAADRNDRRRRDPAPARRFRVRPFPGRR